MRSCQGLCLGQRFGLTDSDAQILYFAASALLAAVLVGVTTYYAVQTKRMVDAMRRPYVVMLIAPDGQGGFRVILGNRGSGAACDVNLSVVRDIGIRLSRWHLPDGWLNRAGQTARVSDLPIVKAGLPLLPPGSEIEVACFATDGELVGTEEFDGILCYRGAARRRFKERVRLVLVTRL